MGTGSECLGSATLIKNVATPFSLGEAGTGTILKTSVSEPNVVGGGRGEFNFYKINLVPEYFSPRFFDHL